MFKVVVVILLILFILFLVFSQQSIQKVDLAQSPAFYKDKRNATLTYLAAVYPQGKDSFEKLSDIELASFYNSLWFYYNCQYQYSENDLLSLTGKDNDTKWDSLPCAEKYPLPYPPQGIFYNFYTYNKYNIPTVYSDSDETKEYLKLSNFGSGRPGIAGTYKNEKTRCSGIMWVNPRTIQRDIWAPNGIINDKKIEPNQADNWLIKTGQKIKWNYPDNWLNGFGNNQYIEITHGPADTGDALNQSPWWWYNACVGSGIFLYLGKTFTSLNKLAGVFDLVTILAKTENGRQKLVRFYGSSDPYDICFGIFAACGYNTITDQHYCDFRYCSCWSYCDQPQLGYSNAVGIKLNRFYDEIVTYQKTLGIMDDLPTKEGIKASIDAARLNLNYRLAHISVNLLADENCFFLAMNLDLDTLQFSMDPNGNDLYVYEIIDIRIPSRFREAAKNRDYSGFMNTSQDNSPLSQNALSNSYKKEIIQEYLQEAYEKKWISLRDPLDVYNDSKATFCPGIVNYNVCDGKPAQSMFCQAPLPFVYKCLGLGNEFNGGTCILTGENPTC